MINNVRSQKGLRKDYYLILGYRIIVLRTFFLIKEKCENPDKSVA